MKFYVPKAHYHIQAPKIEFAMITISYSVVDGEGDSLRVSTWATGRNARVAFKAWLARRRDLDPAAVTFDVVTACKPASRFEPLGKRVEIFDQALAACG